jgi:hypothetical protein
MHIKLVGSTMKLEIKELFVVLSSQESAAINGGRQGRGADDPVGHIRRARGADNVPVVPVVPVV